MKVEFRLLGDVEVWLGERPVDLGPHKQRAVLAALLTEANRAVPLDQIVDRVWADRPPQNPAGSVHTYLSRLRRALAGADVSITHRTVGYTLAVDPDGVDLHRFRSLIARAEAETDDERATVLQRQALDLWRGTPLGALDTPWATSLRQALTRERLAAELDHLDARLRLGQHSTVTNRLSLLAEEHPYDERIAAQFLLALYRCGRQADALHHYHRLRRTLADDLGIDPGKELRGLHQAILANDSSLALPAPTAVPPAGAAPRKPEWITQSQLPLDLKGFVGRERVLDQVQDLLTSGVGVPVVVLSGPPGMGKSVLAVRAAHQLRTAFPDGQWYVRLHGASSSPRDPAAVLAELLRASGMEAGRIPDTLEERAVALRSHVADRRVLLLLDDAADAEQVRPLLPGTAGNAVLVTSRNDLRGMRSSHGAFGITLDVLSPAESRALLVGSLGEARVSTQESAADELAELCGHLPLALGICAANLHNGPDWPLAAYARALGGKDRLFGFTVEGDPQASVRAAFDRSYDTLDPRAARLFALLGLFPGADFTVEAAGALLGDVDAALRALGTLVSANLVQTHLADRYRLHDLLRLYARERVADLAGGEEAWLRLCAYYRSTVEEAVAFRFAALVRLPRERSASGRFPDEEAAQRWLDDERANLVSLIERAAEAGPLPVTWELADELRTYFYHRGHQAEWRATAEVGLDAARRADDTMGEAAMLHSLGTLYQHVGDLLASVEAKTAALEGYRGSGFTLGEAAMLSNIASSYEHIGQMGEALEWQRRSLEAFAEVEIPGTVGNALNTMCTIQFHLGQLPDALRSADEAVRVNRESGQLALAVAPLKNRADILCLLGSHDHALRDGTEALHLCEELGKRHNLASVHEGLAQAHRITGRYGHALDHARKGVEIGRDCGDRNGELAAMCTLGDLYRILGETEAAETWLKEAVAIARTSGMSNYQATATILLARVHLAASVPSETLPLGLAALSLCRELGLVITECRAHMVLADAHGALGDSAEADRHEAEVRRIRERTGFSPASNERVRPE